MNHFLFVFPLSSRFTLTINSFKKKQHTVVLSKKTLKAKGNKEGRPILFGMAIAAMNFLNVPFYFSVGTLLEGNGTIEIFFPVYFFFIGGLTLGSATALLAYVYGSSWIIQRAKFLARYLNFFLSALFFILGILQSFQLYYDI